jgi:glyoxylase-like metal-dependent hydrolase (beta-lactamase superfamily II)
VTGDLKANCYILIDDATQHAIIIDPGANFSAINKELIGTNPLLILLTHGHYDHIGAVSELKSAYKGLIVCIGAADAELLQDSKKNMGYWSNQHIKSFTEDKLLSGNDEINFCNSKIKTLATPGHTQGSTCYFINGLLFSGDTLFKGATGRTDLYGGNQSDLTQSINRLKKLNPQTIVYPGHGLKTTIGAKI